MAEPIKPDIKSRAEVCKLVDAFYDKVRADSLLAPLFAHVNWTAHLPVMYSFWSTVLLGEGSYAGNPISKHLNLSLEQGHFKRWLFLFFQAVNENFEGPRAEEAKTRAQSIAAVMQIKMNLADDPQKPDVT